MIPIRWVRREPPLPPTGAAAEGDAARALADALLARDDDALARWRGVAGGGVLVVLGADLPWAPGVTWLGAMGALLVPCTRQPDLPEDLVEEAILRRLQGAAAAVLPASGRVVPLTAARPLDRAVLTAWRDGA